MRALNRFDGSDREAIRYFVDMALIRVSDLCCDVGCSDDELVMRPEQVVDVTIARKIVFVQVDVVSEVAISLWKRREDRMIP